MAASGGRSRSKRLTSSAAKCCASAAEPPLPHDSTLPPPRSVSTSSSMPRTSGAASGSAAARSSFALSAKCAEIRPARFSMRRILLDVHVEADPARRVRMLGEGADASAQRRAAVQAPGECRVLAPRDVAELVAAPAHRHCVRIVRIVRLARELQPVTDAQLAPKIGGGVIAEAGQRRVLHQEANALFGMGISPRQKKQRGYSPKASRIHCTRALAPS